MNTWSNIGRLLNLIVSFVLFYTGCIQADREDAFMWTLVFSVPAFLTLVAAGSPQAIEMVEVQAVWSISMGFLMCLLVYLTVAALRVLTTVLTFPFETDKATSDLLSHKSWDVVSVFLMLLWLKFLNFASKEYLREAGMTKPQVSAQRMLKIILLFAGLTGCIVTLCYASYSFSSSTSISVSSAI